MKDPSHGFFTSRWLVHSQFLNLGNPLEAIVHYLLIGVMASLGDYDKFTMVSVLVYMVTHWIGFMVSHDLRLSNSHDLTKLLHCVVSQLWENIEFVLKLVASVTYGWDHKLIIHFSWIGSLLMEVGSNRYSQ